MNDAVWKFRTFEEPSLSYTNKESGTTTVGGWNLRRDERFASLIERGLLAEGAALESTDLKRPAVALVTGDFGLFLGGVRYESPDIAVEAATDGQVRDGWDFWAINENGSSLTLRELLTM